MKIVKISDNLKINIEQIYSLERCTNKNEINEWQDKYIKFVNEFSNDPPDLIIDNKIFHLEQGMNLSNDDLQKYSAELDNYIKNIIGEKPKYNENYYIILSTGLKINISKSIYDKIDEYMNNIIAKDNI